MYSSCENFDGVRPGLYNIFLELYITCMYWATWWTSLLKLYTRRWGRGYEQVFTTSSVTC